MARRSFRRNYVAAGAFLILGLALAVYMSVLLSDALENLEEVERYQVVFSLEEGTAGLGRGSPVTLGGQRVGRVLGVKKGYATIDDGDPSTEDPRVVVSQIAEIAVESDLKLYENAKITLTLPLFGTVSGLNIRDVGGPFTWTSEGDLAPLPGAVAQFEVVPPGGTFAGDLAPGLLIQAGFRPEDVDKFRAVIENVNLVSADARAITEELRPLLTGEGNRVESILTNIDETSEIVRAQAEDLSARMNAVFDDVQQVAARLDPLFEDFQGTVVDIRTGVNESRQTVREVQQVIAEQTPRINQIVQDVEAITGRVRNESVDEVNRLLAEGAEAAERFDRLAADLQRLVGENRPEIERAISNARVATDTLKLTMEEVRAQPWRLLQRPKTRELEQQLLYDAARAYAVAASDLRAASASLETALAGEPEQIDTERVQTLQQQLEQQFEDYREAERALLDRISANR